MKELLSPAGNIESVYSAIHAGADAIYVGLKSFSARAYAENFTKEDIKEITYICHLYNVKVYVTLNTLIKDSEVKEFLEIVDYLYEIGVDALLIQDFGMMNLVLNLYDDFPVHASTQFNNTSIETIKLLKDMGVERVVLPRELSLEEIKSIDIDIEKEVFIHGALCVSYSGCCLASSLNGGRSANRGECTGPCRLPYKLYEDNKILKEGYLLSTKELNTGSSFSSLLKTNIDCFKIEGRLKSPEYVYFVTKFYRNLIDGKKVTEEDLNKIKILYNRKFTTGHLFNDDIMNTASSNHLGLKIGKVISIDKHYIKIKLDRTLNQNDGIRFKESKKGMIVNFLYDDKKLLKSDANNICYVKNTIDLKSLDEVYLTSSKVLKEEILNYDKLRIKVNMKFTAKKNEPMSLKIDDVTVYKEPPEVSIKRPITKEEVRRNLNRLKDTVYEIENLEIDMDDDIFIPISKINEIRRDCIEELNKKRTTVKKKGKKNIVFEKLNIDSEAIETIDLKDIKDISKYLNYKALYTEDKEIFNKYKEKINIYYKERRNVLNSKNTERSLINNYSYPNDSIGDYHLNVTNIYSVYYLHKLGYKKVTLSVELDSFEVNNLIDLFTEKFKFSPNVEVVVKDDIELMLIKGNILKIEINKEYYLEDYKQRRFTVYFDGVNTHILKMVEELDYLKCKCSRRMSYKYIK